MSVATPTYSDLSEAGPSQEAPKSLQQQVDLALAPLPVNADLSDHTKSSMYQRITISFTTMEETCQLLNKESMIAVSRGDFEAAATYLHEAMGYASASTSESYHQELAATLNNLGCLAKRLGNFVDAKKYLQDAVSSEVAAFGESMLSTQLNLSTVYTGLGQVSAALLLAQQVVDRTVPVEGNDFATIALHNLAVAQLCSQDVKLRKAGVESLKAALRVSIETLGTEHELTYTIEQKLGRMHQQKIEQRRKQEAANPATAADLAAAAAATRQPVPPPGGNTSHRQAATRALRALDFATPTEDEGTGGAASLPSKKADVMAGSTFVSGSTAPPTDGKQQALMIADVNANASVATGGTSDIHRTQIQPAAGEENNNATGKTTSGVDPDPPRGSSSHLTSKALVAHNKTDTNTDRAIARSRSRNSEYRPFMRFAADLQTVPPPMPISFKEVKAEARIKAGDPATRDVVVMKGEGGDGVGGGGADRKEKVSIFKKSVDEKRKRQERDIVEEQRIQEDQKKRAAEAIVKAKEELRMSAAQKLREKYAARTICKQMIEWYHQNPKNKKPHRRYNARTRDQERDEGLARSVAKFARRWLLKTAGQRLLVHLTSGSGKNGRKMEYSTVVSAVKTVQRSWKTLLSARSTVFLKQIRTQERDQIMADEKQFFAAMTMQRWIRSFLARNKMTRERAAQYTEHILVMQRWGRMMLFRRTNIMSVLSEGRKMAFAATKIQSQWRGHAARLAVAVLRLKRKIRRMREKERNAIIKMQRVGRGYRYRIHFQEAQFQYRMAEMEKKRPRSPLGEEAGAQRESQIDGLLRLKQVYPQGEGRQEEMRQVAEEEREFYLKHVVDEQAKRHVAEYTTRISRRQVDLVLAHEQNHRQHELNTLRQERGAKCIQRHWRRWWYSMSDDRRHRLEYFRAELQYSHYMAKEQSLKEQISKEQLQLTNDLGKEAREGKLALLQEAAEVADEIDQMAPPSPVRPIEEREAAAKGLKSLQGALKRQEEREGAWLRTEANPSGVRTFRTVKEKQREDNAKFYRTA